MIKELTATLLLSTSIGLQNTTNTELKKYINWQPTSAQTYVDEVNNIMYYMRYITPSQNYNSDIYDIRQNCYYQFSWNFDDQKAEQKMFVITEIDPDTSIDGQYNTKIEYKFNTNYYNLAFPDIDLSTTTTELNYSSLNATQKGYIETALTRNNPQTIIRSTFTQEMFNLLTVMQTGTTIQSLTGSYLLNLPAQIQTLTNDFDTGKKIYITRYDIEYTSLYTNAGISDVDSAFDILMFYPETTANNLEWTAPEQTGEIVDIPGIMFTMLGMPFAFVAQAFDLTVFPGTPYAVNLSHIFLAIAGGAILLFVIKKVLK